MTTDTHKLCRTCKEELLLELFHRDKRMPDGHYDICRDCRTRHRLITNISTDTYQKLLQAQGYACAICGITAEESQQSFNVDHNHQTHQVRGLLCLRCNVGLGYFKDDTTRLSLAIEYLMRTDATA